MAAANRYRPRAPSPKRSGSAQHDFDSDNTYSLVQDSMRDRKMTQAARIDRMFGDSANEDNDHDKKPNVHLGNNKFGSVSSNSTNSSSLHGGAGGSLASLYQARKQGAPLPPLPPSLLATPTSVKKGDAVASSNGSGGSHYDAVTVEQIKAQFQAQIEAMMLSQERNTSVKPPVIVGNGLPKFSALANNGPIKNGHIPSAAERELSGIKDIQRGKSFLEARTAVQKHIEKMLNHNNGVSNSQQVSSPLQSPPNLGSSPGPGGGHQVPLLPPVLTNNLEAAINRNKFEMVDQVKHTMHGVSHAIPGELDDIEKPPPVHYGVDAAIRSGSVALKTGGHNNHGGNLSSSRKHANHFLSNESLTTIIKEPSLARGQSQESVVNVRVTSPQSDGRKSAVVSTSPQISPQSKKIIPLRNGHDSDVSNYRQQQASSSMATTPTTPNSRLSNLRMSKTPTGSKTPTSPVPSAAMKAKEYVRHKVDYLGALPISASRSTNLAALSLVIRSKVVA